MKFDKNNVTSINLNGYDTYYFETQDDIGNCLIIGIPQNADNSITDIVGRLVAGHLIKQVVPFKINDTRVFKAYF